MLAWVDRFNCKAESLPRPPLLSLLSGVRRPRGALLFDKLSWELIERAPDGILIADMRVPGQGVTYVNAAFESITGYGRKEVAGRNCRFLQGGDRLQPEVADIRNAIAAGEEINVVLRNYRKDGRQFWNNLHLLPLAAESGLPTHYVGFVRDVTDAVATSSRLEQIKHTDALTGCLNRDSLVESLSRLTSSGPVLLLKLDVARFHEINGGYGYDVGDELLRAVAQRLRTLNANLVARLGNDQFALAVAVSRDLDVRKFLERVTDTLSAPFVLLEADLSVRFAIGYVVGQAGDDAMTLARRAGAALAGSKADTLRQPCEYVPEREARAHERLQMTSELQRALLEKEFIYYYQPQFDLTRSAVTGAEALIRWRHPLFGLQQPGRFVKLAEETGLILDISSMGFPDVARFAAAINVDRDEPLSFSYNVPLIEFTHRNMSDFVTRVLEEAGADPAWFTLELTESLFAEDTPEMHRIFDQLRALGVGLSIDDFGTGYSSLRYLERFPLTEIKIDRSFVSGLPHSRAKRVIVEAVIKLGVELGVRVIGEGVETEVERDTLAAMGCTVVQGYLFSPPLPAADFEKVVGGPDRDSREDKA